MLLSVFGILFAGTPLTVVHSHADATSGHVHEVSEHQHAVEHEHHDHYVDEELDSSSSHVHALDILPPGIAATPHLSVSLLPPQSLSPAPVDTWLPDKPVSVLFRPPIA